MRHMALGPGSEFDLVRRMIDRWGDAASGIGSDAAALALPPGEQLVVSTDTALEHVHFRREWVTAPEIGYRATAAALSDLAAAAATPCGVLLALTLPDAWREAVDGLADGVGQAVRACDTIVVGGNLTYGDALSLTVTVLGTATRPLSRRGAVAGDVVYVTGRFGGPAAAVTAWRAGREPDPAARARFAGPVPRCREGRWLAAHGATAAVDVADGLVSDLDHLAAASAVRIAIDLEQVPRLAGVSPVEAGRAGEEYELAVTAPPDLDCQAFTDRFGIPLTPIGTVAPRRHDGRASRLEICVKGQRVDPPVGYDHFSP